MHDETEKLWHSVDRRIVQNVQSVKKVQSFKPSPFILPRVAGEDRGGGLERFERIERPELNELLSPEINAQ
jgi:hypothetical protein